MKFIAIAAITRDKEVVGARILDTDKLKSADLNIEQIEYLIKQGNTVRNITLEVGKIEYGTGNQNSY